MAGGSQLAKPKKSVLRALEKRVKKARAAYEKMVARAVRAQERSAKLDERLKEAEHALGEATAQAQPGVAAVVAGKRGAAGAEPDGRTPVRTGRGAAAPSKPASAGTSRTSSPKPFTTPPRRRSGGSGSAPT
jgi:hypothetical protein